MILPIRKKVRCLSAFSACLLLLNGQPAYAAGNAASALFGNPLVTSLLSLMLLLLIIIAILGNILLGAADIKVKKDKKKPAVVKAAACIFFLLVTGPALFAQNGGTTAAATLPDTIGGMSPFAFYTIISVIFLELLVILVLLIQIRSLLKAEKEKIAAQPEAAIVRKPTISWWMRLNSFRPAEQEADLDLGHDYDGIRELDNRLPPWWLYGFYLTIIIAGVYLWRFHVSHAGPSSREEYERSVASAEIEIKEFLKKKGDAVDENTVSLLSSPEDLDAGKTIFIKSCTVCHKENGAGDIGPNLTDNYWLHGADVKSVFKTIRYGINAMPQWQNSLSNKQIAQVTSYVKSLKGTNPANPKAAQGELYDDATPPEKPGADSSKPKENKVTPKPVSP